MMAMTMSPDDQNMFAAKLKRTMSQPHFQSQQTSLHRSTSTSRLLNVNRSRLCGSHVASKKPQLQASPREPTLQLQESFLPSTVQNNMFHKDTAFKTEDSKSTRGRPQTTENFSMDAEERPAPALHSKRKALKPTEGRNNRKKHPLRQTNSSKHEKSWMYPLPDLVDLLPKGFDDISVDHLPPTFQVDFLSHDWKEEKEIWRSWKHVITNRVGYHNAARLENASWRTWMKAKNRLGTIGPETLNWLKEHDVTWLYGPFGEPGDEKKLKRALECSGSGRRGCKKPILKKKTVSEIMLQYSLIATSMLQRSTMNPYAQQRNMPNRAPNNYATQPLEPLTRHNSLAPSSVASPTPSPSPSIEKKHIHFNEKVEQCIAVEAKGYDTDYFSHLDDDYDSDEGIVMKPLARKKSLIPAKRPALQRSQSVDTRTIASLPSTTLKYEDDSPTAESHFFDSSGLSPCSSQATLRPSLKSRIFFEDSDDEMEEDGDVEVDTFGDEDIGSDSDSEAELIFGSSLKAKATTADLDALDAGKHEIGQGMMQDQGESSFGSDLRRSVSTSSLGKEPSGLRRTTSDLVMTHEEGEQPDTTGVFGRLIDTINTARDIAHVVWNVGWRH